VAAAFGLRWAFLKCLTAMGACYGDFVLTLMKRIMLAYCHQLKILRAVIITNSVLVMDSLFWFKVATKQLFHYKTMHEYPFPLMPYTMIARLTPPFSISSFLRSDGSTLALARAIFRPMAQAWLDGVFIPTLLANKNNGHNSSLHQTAIIVKGCVHW